VVSGCSSTLKAPTLQANGRFATGATVAPEMLKVTGAFDRARHGKMAVVLNFTEDQTVRSFYSDSIKNAKLFDQVLSEAELEKHILQNRIENVTDTSSLISLRNMAESQGPFLVIRPYFEYKGGYDFRATLEAIDANTGETLFSAEKKAFNWAGLDKPLFYPLLNAFLDWAQGKTTATVTAAVAASGTAGK
jgi:hypothetical protein